MIGNDRTGLDVQRRALGKSSAQQVESIKYPGPQNPLSGGKKNIVLRPDWDNRASL